MVASRDSAVRGDLGPQTDQGLGQLAGSRAKVEHPQRWPSRAGTGPTGQGRFEGPADRGFGVAGTVLPVCGRGGPERRAV